KLAHRAIFGSDQKPVLCLNLWEVNQISAHIKGSTLNIDGYEFPLNHTSVQQGESRHLHVLGISHYKLKWMNLAQFTC
ncbi:hypothetical protein J4727_17905, partial [Providencia rettgeri]|nr:hypothetical protein [Providencia rettgeri]